MSGSMQINPEKSSFRQVPGAITFIVSPGKRLGLFICLALLGWVISGVVGDLLFMAGGKTTKIVRIAAILQSVFMMILPAIADAVIVTRQPASFLALDRKFTFPMFLCGLGILFLSAPLTNWLVEFNENLTLPAAMGGMEGMMRKMEELARDNIALMMGGNSTANLIMSILIMGVFAGLGEELLYRGAFLRTLLSMKMNYHAAVWIVAIVFSALHFQFYGFIPRTLLGAFFGYSLVWSGSLWLPVILHMFNNIVYVATTWQTAASGIEADALGAERDFTEWYYVVASLALTVAVIYVFHRIRYRKPGIS